MLLLGLLICCRYRFLHRHMYIILTKNDNPLIDTHLYLIFALHCIIVISSTYISASDFFLDWIWIGFSSVYQPSDSIHLLIPGTQSQRLRLRATLHFPDRNIPRTPSERTPSESRLAHYERLPAIRGTPAHNWDPITASPSTRDFPSSR